MRNINFLVIGLWSVCLCGFIVLVGCGNNVRGFGSVTFADGTPLTVGEVRVSNEQFQYTGPLEADGSFELGGLSPGSGLPPGTYQVCIINAKQDDVWLISEKFRDSSTSGITFEVVKGKKEPFNITVEPPPAAPKKRK